MKFELNFESGAGSTAAVMKPCLDPPTHAQMAEGKKKKPCVQPLSLIAVRVSLPTHPTLRHKVFN